MHLLCDDCAIGGKPNGEKALILGKNIPTSFSGSLYTIGFAVFNYAMGKLMGNSLHFLCDEVYHRMEIGLECNHTMGKV